MKTTAGLSAVRISKLPFCGIRMAFLARGSVVNGLVARSCGALSRSRTISVRAGVMATTPNLLLDSDLEHPIESISAKRTKTRKTCRIVVLNITATEVKN